MGRNKLDDKELKKHRSFRASDKTIDFLKKLSGVESYQKALDLLIEKAKKRENRKWKNQ